MLSMLWNILLENFNPPLIKPARHLTVVNHKRKPPHDVLLHFCYKNSTSNYTNVYDQDQYYSYYLKLVFYGSRSTPSSTGVWRHGISSGLPPYASDMPTVLRGLYVGLSRIALECSMGTCSTYHAFMFELALCHPATMLFLEKMANRSRSLQSSLFLMSSPASHRCLSL